MWHGGSAEHMSQLFMMDVVRIAPWMKESLA